MRSIVDLDDVPVRVRASIGIAHHYAGMQDVAHLLSGADMAMYAAKRNGKGDYQLFEPTMQAEVTERLNLDADLRHAIDVGQFRLQYQPIIALATEQTVGFEALLRWNRPERGPMRPDAFIRILEENGLIVPVGRWVLREACEQTARWRTRSGRPWWISVNVSPRQLRDPGFLEQVRQALAAAALPPPALILEITEGVMVTDVKHTIDKLNTLKDLGVRMAVDDFGTGYSSLRYLQTLPGNSVKLDRSFIAEIQDGPGRRPSPKRSSRSVRPCTSPSWPRHRDRRAARLPTGDGLRIRPRLLLRPAAGPGHHRRRPGPPQRRPPVGQWRAGARALPAAFLRVPVLVALLGVMAAAAGRFVRSDARCELSGTPNGRRLRCGADQWTVGNV
jgi:EAL domain-containing protein (putative c-di-GMP-specific phosphodiesterase class I)